MGPSCGGRVGPGVELGVPLAQGLRIGGYHQGRGLVSGGQSSKTEKDEGIKGTHCISNRHDRIVCKFKSYLSKTKVFESRFFCKKI